MIRFSCPGCGATYSVDDAKGGKTGKCPKCQTQFQIPMPEGAAAPPASGVGSVTTLPPPPPADPNAPVEIAPCPGCQARLSVATSDLGADVECPYCKTVYKAKKPGTGLSPVAPPPKRSELDDDRPSRRRRDEDDEDDEDDRPSRRGRRDEEDEDRPSRRRRDEDDEDERPSRRRRRDEEEEDDRPRKRRRRRGGSYEPHRGGLILALGILSFVGCGIFTGIPAWIMGKGDLARMDSGSMDPEGRTLTNVGRILGMICVILTCVMFLVYCLIFAVAGIGGAAGGR